VPVLAEWAVGGTALFYWALGILPFKDGFYSSNVKQLGGQTVGPELHPDREALMATLSCAMVGPMDGIELLNKSRVMASCRSDGLVLKPDAPLTTSESCFLRADPTCQIYHTFTDMALIDEMTDEMARSSAMVKGSKGERMGSKGERVAATTFRTHYLFSNNVVPITAEMLHQPSPATHVWFNWYTGELGTFGHSNNLTAGYEGHLYLLVLPLLPNGWALLGEVHKHVPLSRKRFRSVTTAGTSLTALVAGIKGEDVYVCACHCGNGRSAAPSLSAGQVCLTVHFDEDTDKRVTFTLP